MVKYTSTKATILTISNGSVVLGISTLFCHHQIATVISRTRHPVKLILCPLPQTLAPTLILSVSMNVIL